MYSTHRHTHNHLDNMSPISSLPSLFFPAHPPPALPFSLVATVFCQIPSPGLYSLSIYLLSVRCSLHNCRSFPWCVGIFPALLGAYGTVIFRNQRPKGLIFIFKFSNYILSYLF